MSDKNKDLRLGNGWEKIDKYTARLRVHRGWMVCHKTFVKETQHMQGRTVTLPVCESSIFVEDQGGLWKLEENNDA